MSLPAEQNDLQKCYSDPNGSFFMESYFTSLESIKYFMLNKCFKDLGIKKEQLDSREVVVVALDNYGFEVVEQQEQSSNKVLSCTSVDYEKGTIKNEIND